MDKQSRERRLRLAFKGGTFADGPVPVTVLAAKLQALQNLLFHAAAAVKRDTSARRGVWVNRYREVAELSFAASHHSDLVVDLAIATPDVLGPDFDVAQKAVDLLFDLGQAVQSNPEGINVLDIRKDDRGFLLRALESFMPNVLDDYRIELENCSPDAHPTLVFTGETRRSIREYLVREATPTLSERMTIVGELIKIHVDVGPAKITVRQNSREIDCFYPDSVRDQISNLLAGSLVEVTGEATLDEQERVKHLDTVYDVSMVSMEPLRMMRFEHDNVVYPLKSPLLVTVEYRDGLWVYHSSSINLWGYGERREDALRDLHESFAYVWREFATEDDAVLDEKARQIKRALLTITDKQPAGV